MDYPTYLLLFEVLLFILLPSLIMLYAAHKRMNAFLGFLGIFILVCGGTILPTWSTAIGVIVIGVFFYRYIMMRRNGN